MQTKAGYFIEPVVSGAEPHYYYHRPLRRTLHRSVRYSAYCYTPFHSHRILSGVIHIRPLRGLL